MTEHYYGKQAYNSQAIPDQRYQTPSFGRSLAKLQLPWGNTQEVFYPNIPPQGLRAEEKGQQDDQKKGRKNPFSGENFHFRYDHEVYRFAKAALFTRIIAFLRVFGFVTMCGYGVIIIPIILIDLCTTDLLFLAWFFDRWLLIFSIVGTPVVIWLLFYGIMRFLPPSWWLRPSKGSRWELNRKTGLVTIYQRRQQPFIAPFYEFDPYVNMTADRSGFTTYTLHLAHRYSSQSFNAMGFVPMGYAEQTCFAQWDFLQNFMDTSRPLPDAPEWEASRPLDPVTAAYDQQTGRNPRYWIDMDETTWKQVSQAMRDKILIIDTMTRLDIMESHLLKQ